MPSESSSKFKNLEDLLGWVAQRYGRELIDALVNRTLHNRRKKEQGAAEEPPEPTQAHPHAAPAQGGSPLVRLAQVEAAQSQLTSQVAQLRNEAGMRIGNLEEKLSSEIQRLNSGINTIIDRLQNSHRTSVRLAWSVGILLAAVIIESIILVTKR